jgi:hypothetical protein
MSNITKEEIKKLAELLRDNKQEEEKEHPLAIALRKLKPTVELQKAHSEHIQHAIDTGATHKGKVSGRLKAYASVDNPLILSMDLWITDFNPNKNKQGIPKTEAQNILKTAVNTPVKIAFDDHALGHHGAKPIGVISTAELQNDMIIGRAIIWKQDNQAVADYLLAQAEHFVSWEIYYSDSTLDSNGIQWLEGCYFGGTCLVDTPAYGDKAKAHILQ